MSISYTSISNSELHRLRASADREAKTRAELNEIKRKRDLREREIKAHSEAEISRLNDTIANLKKGNDKIRADGAAAVKKLNADFVKKLDDERERVNHRIDTLSERVDRINGDLNARFDEIDARIKDTRGRAEIYAEELSALVDTIGNLKPEKFGYGKSYDTLKSLEKSVKEDLKSENFEAALAICQREVMVAAEAVAALTLLNNDFNEGINRAKLKESELLETFEEYSAENVISYTDLSGKVQKTAFDIGFWSGGALYDAEADLKKIREKIEKSSDNSFGMRELYALEDDLSDLEEALSDTEEKAKDAFFASCNVESIAHNLNAIMRDEGYFPCESGFFENDERESFNMTYTDDGGNSVAFVISAGEGEDARIAMETYASDPEDDEIKESTGRAVTDALKERGVSVGDTVIDKNCNSVAQKEKFIEKVSKKARKQKN